MLDGAGDRYLQRGAVVHFAWRTDTKRKEEEMIRVFFIACLLVGCSSVERQENSSAKSTDHVNATLNESGPAPVLGPITATGNANVNVGVPDELPTREVTRSSKSDSFEGRSMSELYSAHSSLIWVGLGAGLLLIVVALKLFESSATGKALGSVVTMANNRLQDLTPGTEAFNAIQALLRDIKK